MFIPANLDITGLSNDKLIRKPRFWLPIVVGDLVGSVSYGTWLCFFVDHRSVGYLVVGLLACLGGLDGAFGISSRHLLVVVPVGYSVS